MKQYICCLEIGFFDDDAIALASLRCSSNGSAPKIYKYIFANVSNGLIQNFKVGNEWMPFVTSNSCKVSSYIYTEDEGKDPYEFFIPKIAEAIEVMDVEHLHKDIEMAVDIVLKEYVKHILSRTVPI